MLLSHDLAAFFSYTFLFKEMNIAEIERCIKGCKIALKDFNKKDLIASFDTETLSVGFVLEGECQVVRSCSGSIIPINKLKKFAPFGVASAFSSEHKYTTKVIASRPCKIVFIDRDDLLKLLSENSHVALNIIQFLSNRISFLNDKISTFSNSDCVAKVARLLVLDAERNKSENFIFNCKVAAETLNIGRASLYRAIKSLSELGYISHENKKIIIKNINGLKGISE